MKDSLKAVFGSYAEIFFLPSGAVGAVLFALTLAHPPVAAAGLVSVLAAYGFARLLGMEKPFLQSGYYTYNPLLVGLSLGNLFQPSWLALAFIASAGMFTFLVTVSLANAFWTHFRLPILSLPFVIVSSIAYLASLRYSNLLVATHADSALLSTDFGLPYWLTGFFKAFGAVLFAPSVAVGLLLSLLLLRYSRILLLLALLGYYSGALLRSLMLGSPSQAFADLNNFNFIFIAMALGGVFLVPSLTSYLFALIGVAISTVFMDAVTGFWSSYGIPAFTLPFNLVTLGFVYVLGLLAHPLVATALGRTPEETLGNFHANRLRHRGQALTLHLPFSGKWTVWQGWDGAWTHKGPWRHAYDFVITDETGQTHAGDGTRPEDYHCYHKPVLSPVRGRVVQLVDDLPDSAIGAADDTNNWGNLVILQDARGHFVELSHFAPKSLRVKKGDWVERGALLGLCGNSGYSPQPHLHVQVQATDAIGAASLPFSFVSYAEHGEYHANHLPAEKRVVEPLFPDKRLENITNFVLDEEQHYEVFRAGRRLAELKLKVEMAPDGSFQLTSSSGRLSFGKHEGTFYCHGVSGDDPWLRLLHLALPRMPLAYREGLTWRDSVPVGLVTSGLRKALVGFLSSFHPRLATARVTQTFVSESRIDVVIEAGPLHPRRTASVEFDRRKGFASVTVDEVTLRRSPDF
jgi:urea transporter/murein DD-endopeptidase MepM/ murein hydrolase activator NlpD